MDELERHLEERTAAADELERARMEERDSLYTMDHRNARRLPRLPHDLDLDRDRVEGVGLLDPRTLMEDNERRMSASAAPPSTLEFLDETREPKYMDLTENERVRDAMRQREREKRSDKNRVPSAAGVQRRGVGAQETGRGGPAEGVGTTNDPGAEGPRGAGHRGYAAQAGVPSQPAAPGGSVQSRRHGAEEGGRGDRPDGRVRGGARYRRVPPVRARGDVRDAADDPEQVGAESTAADPAPPSRHFSITELKYPSDHGLLAPGNAAYATVRFKPDSLADYEDFVTVITETSKFRVECSARRHPPCLTLDQSLDVGYVLVGNDVETRMPFKNVGGEGRFRLVDEADWPEHTTPLTLPNEDAMLSRGELKDPEPVPCIGVAPFRIGPGYMELAPLDVEQLRIGFAPQGPEASCSSSGWCATTARCRRSR